MGGAVLFLFAVDSLSARFEGVVNIAEARTTLTADGRSMIDRAKQLASDAGVPATGELVEGSPADVIAHHAATFDLVVMGSHGRGSVTHAVLERIRSPLLIIRSRPEGHPPG